MVCGYPLEMMLRYPGAYVDSKRETTLDWEGFCPIIWKWVYDEKF